MVADILFVPLVPLFVIALALVLELVEERLLGPDAARPPRSRRGIRRPGHARGRLPDPAPSGSGDVVLG